MEPSRRKDAFAKAFKYDNKFRRYLKLVKTEYGV